MAITNSALPFILERVNGRWPNSRVKVGSMPETATLESIIKEQTADIRAFGLPDEQQTFITWLLNCGQVPAACVDSCVITGPSSSTFKQTASIDQCRENSFSEPYDAWRNNEFGMQDAIASQLDRIMKDHLEYVEQYAIGIINSNAGVNAALGSAGWTQTGTVTTVPTIQASNTAIFGHLFRNAKRNRFDDPYLLSGEALAQLEFMATTSAANGEGKGDAARAARFRKYFDYYNIDTVNSPDLDFYMIDHGTLAFGSKGYFPLVGDAANPRGAQEFTYGKLRFSIRNRFVPELIHDVQFMDSCTTGVESSSWNVKTRYKVLAAPIGCTANNTGIIHYRLG